MRYYYVIKAGYSAEILKVATEKKTLQCSDCYEEIGCELVEMVPVKLVGRNQYTMILDEEGKLTGKALNVTASTLADLYPDYIVGTVIITKNYNFDTFTEEQASLFEAQLAGWQSLRSLANGRQYKVISKES